MNSTPTTKRCSDCKTIKPATAFHNHKRQPDGLSVRCKKCVYKRANPHKARMAEAQELESGDRYSIVRNVSRRTGQASWGIWDSRPCDRTNPVIHIADNLKDAILECERLNTPAPKLKYTKRGQTGVISDDDDDNRTDLANDYANASDLEEGDV